MRGRSPPSGEWSNQIAAPESRRSHREATWPSVIACSTPSPTASCPFTTMATSSSPSARACRCLLFLLWPPLAWLAVLITALDRLFLPRSPPRDAAARGAGHRPRRRAHLRHRARAPSGRARPRREPAPARLDLPLASSTCTSTARPVAGRIVRSIYVPGSFLNAAADKASEENERRGIVIDTGGDSEIAMVQIAGPDRAPHRHLRATRATASASASGSA